MDEREAYRKYLNTHLASLVGTVRAFRTHGSAQERADYHRLVAEWKVSDDAGARRRLREEMNLIADAVYGRVMAAGAREAGDQAGAADIEARYAAWLRRRKAARAVLDRLGLHDVSASVDADDGRITLSFLGERKEETPALVRQFAAELRAELGERRTRKVQAEHVGGSRIPARVLRTALYLASRYELRNNHPPDDGMMPPLQLLR